MMSIMGVATATTYAVAAAKELRSSPPTARPHDMHLDGKRISVSLATAEFKPAQRHPADLHRAGRLLRRKRHAGRPRKAPAICLMPWELERQPPMTGRFAI